MDGCKKERQGQIIGDDIFGEGQYSMNEPEGKPKVKVVTMDNLAPVLDIWIKSGGTGQFMDWLFRSGLPNLKAKVMEAKFGIKMDNPKFNKLAMEEHA